MRVNVESGFFLAQAAGARHARAGARTIHRRDVGGDEGRPAQCLGLLDEQVGARCDGPALAIEWAKDGVTVNAIPPGGLGPP